MKIHGSQSLTHPARLVFETLRDKTPELVAIMPNIEGVEVLSREEQPPVVKLYNRWQGAQSDVPAVARPFVKKELISWFDRAAWNEETLSCEWKIEAVVGRDCFSCMGTTVITADGEDRSHFTLEGELSIDPDHVPGVPKFLARKVRAPLERFIARAISPNLTGIASAVQRYLDGQRGG
jgi:hypothetical protein